MDADATQFAFGVALFVPVVILAVIYLRKPKSALPLPPGPPGEFLLGHLRVVPSYKPELAYQKWGKEYNSDILSFNILGQPVIVLNSVAAAQELLDKRGANYSDRPRFALFEEMGWSGTLTFLRWGKRFQMHRKLIQSSFTKPAIVKYREFQTTQAHRLMQGIMRDSGRWEDSLRTFATAIVLGIGFGVSIKDEGDPYVQMAVDASYALGHGGAPAGTPVDFFPPIRHLPNWLARSTSLKFARDWRWSIRAIHDKPYAHIAQQFKSGTAQPSFITSLLEQDADLKSKGQANPMTESDIKGAAGAVYAAGQDTTWSTLVVFILNMVLHPEIQLLAQQQLDDVVGPDRLPEFADRDSLPLIDYIVQETLRWGPVSPIGVPHRSLADDTYKGFFIPAGSFVYANAQAMCYDDETYERPEAFDPLRFAGRPGSERAEREGLEGRGEPFPTGHFGFGRRICPGRHLAEASVWIVVATMLHTLDIGKAVGPDGKEITPTVVLTPGLTSHPERFECSLRPRSKQAEDLVAHAL